MDFKDYCNHSMQDDKTEKFDAKITQDFEKSAQEILDKYSGLSSDVLLNELLKQTNQKKLDGSLTNEKLDSMYRVLASNLPAEKRQNLDQIFDRLKQ